VSFVTLPISSPFMGDDKRQASFEACDVVAMTDDTQDGGRPYVRVHFRGGGFVAIAKTLPEVRKIVEAGRAGDL
jgi:hypothetical protein